MGYIAGRRGIRFQNIRGEIVTRKPGDPVPEVELFPKLFPKLNVLLRTGHLGHVADEEPKKEAPKVKETKVEKPKVNLESQPVKSEEGEAVEASPSISVEIGKLDKPKRKRKKKVTKRKK